MDKSKLPQWLIIVGQSGCGKGTAFEFFKREYAKLGISPLLLSSGDLIRDRIATGTPLSKKIKAINDQGLRQPAVIPAALWMAKLLDEPQEEPYILHEGSPRLPEEFDMMWSLVKPGYISSVQILEIICPDEVCHQRLAERTKKDKRIDLSVDGSPGVPDDVKIVRKLGWWTMDRASIVERIMNAGVYTSVVNNGSLQVFEDQLYTQFGFERD